MRATVALGIAAISTSCLSAEGSARAAKPNIVLIMADDLGYECIGANGGSSYKTPVLDRLARTGVRFEHCYSQPLCTPSRVQIMTGIYNVRNYLEFGLLSRSVTTFAHLLKKNDYTTCIAGKWQLGSQPDAAQHFGFDQACLWQHTIKDNKTSGRDNRYANPTIDINGKTVALPKGSFGPDVCSDFICDFMEKHKSKPFLVYYPMILTHCPFVPTPDSRNWNPESRGSKSYKGDAKHFGDMVAYMDKMVGKITDKLDALGLRENTLILFTGDNGTDYPIVSELNGRQVAGGKGSMTDAGTRVPLIANWPGVASEGKVCSDLVDFSDFLPTLCDSADVSIPSNLNIDGRSFLPQIKGQKGEPREWIYSWYLPRRGSTSSEWARNQRYKLYRTGEFYDLGKDVLESEPLTDYSPEAQQARVMLQAALDQYKDARPVRDAATKGEK